MFQYFSFVYQSVVYKTITIHNTYYATNIYNGKRALSCFRNIAQLFEKTMFFLFFIKKIPATESICAFLLYFFFALSISSVKFSKKVFLSDGRKIFPACLIVQRLDCQSATLNIFHRLAQAVLAVPNLNRPAQKLRKLTTAPECLHCLCRRFKNIKEKRGLFNRSLFPARQVPAVYFPVLKAELFCHGSVNC